jgi:hypothetical protein
VALIVQLEPGASVEPTGQLFVWAKSVLFVPTILMAVSEAATKVLEFVNVSTVTALVCVTFVIGKFTVVGVSVRLGVCPDAAGAKPQGSDGGSPAVPATTLLNRDQIRRSVILSGRRVEILGFPLHLPVMDSG